MKAAQNALFNKQNLLEIQKTIKKHCPNKKPTEIIAVTKKQTLDSVSAAIKNNLIKIGENQVQEAEKKFEQQKEIRKKIELHLIGHLQTNKANKAVKIFDVIQTVDSQKILKKINSAGKKHNKKQRIFFQVNIGKDLQKKGFSVSSLWDICKTAGEYQNIIVEGLMAILPAGKTKKENKDLFIKTISLQKEIQKQKIKTCLNTSLGMSGDYVEAVQAGATHIRIGSSLFGTRK
tara:strand:+ start:8813 stop:9511 length:699 start_codon:yes stop_codon:yes gene_type:complete